MNSFELKLHHVRLKTSLWPWQLGLATEGVSLSVCVAPARARSPHLGHNGEGQGPSEQDCAWAQVPEDSLGSWDPSQPEEPEPIPPPPPPEPEEAVDRGPFLVTLIVKTKTLYK